MLMKCKLVHASLCSHRHTIGSNSRSAVLNRIVYTVEAIIVKTVVLKGGTVLEWGS